MIQCKFFKSSTLPVALLSATLAFGVSPIYNKVYAAEMATQQANTIKGKVIDSNGEPVFLILSGIMSNSMKIII